MTGDRAFFGAKTNAELAVLARKTAGDIRDDFLVARPKSLPPQDSPLAAFLEELAERLTTLKGWKTLDVQPWSEED